MSDRPLHLFVRSASAVALVTWVAVLAVTLLSPSAAGPTWLVGTVADELTGLGVPASLAAPERVEFGLNVAAFVPVSFFGSMVWPRYTWRDWTAIGFAASFAVEVFQAVALDARSATNVDIVANTLGTFLGALAGAVLVAATVGRRPAHASERRADLPHWHASTEELDSPR